MNKRMKKNIEILSQTTDYKLLNRDDENRIATFTYTNNGNEFQIRIQFPANYPLTKPVITVLQPFEYEIPVDYWKPINTIVTILKPFFDSVPQYTIPSRAYLVLGGYPVKESMNRSLYQNPAVFIADTEVLQKTEPFQDRYFRVNYNTPQLYLLAKQYSKMFDMVVFDWSTFRFFEKNQSFQIRLGMLLELIKDTGILVIESPQGDFFSGLSGSIQNMIQQRSQIKIDNINRITNALDTLGYTYEYPETTKYNSFLEEVYGDRGKDLQLMIVKRKQKGGKRQGSKRKTRRAKKSKGTRRH
jgi:hypothetical protein